MNSLYDSKYYDFSYRSILTKENILKLYTENDAIDVETDVEFDIKSTKKSSIDYFSSSIVGSVVYSLINNAKYQNLSIEELEAKINLQIENPLTFLNVRGYDENPYISSCQIKIYIYIDIEDSKFNQFCESSLKKCILYNTLKNTIKFDIKFIQIF